MPLQYIIANWKQFLSYNTATEWLALNGAELTTLAQRTNTQLIICPSYETLATACAQLGKTSIAVGAQSCSPYSAGAHTGFVDALSLKELGVTYCIIGHSERRTDAHEDTATISAQLQQLLLHAIIPIVCIGETEQEYLNGRTREKLQEQLRPIIQGLSSAKNIAQPICIAYEPIYAIGTGIVPTHEHLNNVFTWLAHYAQQHTQHSMILLYGGSVSPQTMHLLVSIPGLQGFLIGKASTDFQELKNIVSLVQ